MQEQLVCRGCRNTVLYPRGATNVGCALCNTVSMVPLHHPHGIDVAHIVCGGYRNMLMYTRGPSSVRCSCCQTLNLVPRYAAPPRPCNQFAHINCGNCRTTLMYPYGASSVNCALCQFVTNVNMGNGRVPNMPNGAASSGTMPSTSTLTPPFKTQTVVVENPMSVNECGKLVSNVVVGVTTGKN